MTPTREVRRLLEATSVWCLIVALLAGCRAAPALRGPEVFAPDSYPTLVLGYFSSAQHLGTWECHEEAFSNESGTVDCFSPAPSATLRAQEVLFGLLPAARLDLLLLSAQPPHHFPQSRSHPVLVELENGHGFQRYYELVRTNQGWAVPVVTDWDHPALPCGGDDLLHAIPLRFEAGWQRRPLDTYPEDVIEQMRADPAVRTDGEFVYFTLGIPLTQIRAARERMVSHPEAYSPCLAGK